MKPNEENPSETTEVVSDSGTSDSEPTNGDGIAELRKIIVGSEQVSEVLPEAITRTSDEELSDATLPIVERNIQQSVLRNPKVLADALFPVIGPAIRKAISTALSSMVQSFNQTLEYSVSPKGLKWRLEALRTGRSFGEVVMLKTLQYRVEQVFLIHRETGLLLQHVSVNPGDVEDADMVGAMLTAINDFAHDSFEVDSEAMLDSFKISGLAVWLESGPDTILAAVIRGNPPIEFRDTLATSLEQIEYDFEQPLNEFEGNADVFEGARPILERCLVSQSARSDEKRGLLSPANIVLGAVGLLCAAVISFYAWDYWKWTSLLADIRNEPGYVLADYQRGWFTHSVTGLKDPFAKDGNELLSRNRYDSDDVVFDWREYSDTAPSFVLRRANETLKPPQGARLKLEGKTLIFEGNADSGWVDDAERLSPLIPGIDKFEARVDLNAKLSDSSVTFECGKTTLLADREVAGVLDTVERLSRSERVRIDVVGHASATGTEEINDQFRLERANKVVQRIQNHLDDKGLTDRVSLKAVGEPELGKDCKVTFNVEPLKQ